MSLYNIALEQCPSRACRIVKPVSRPFLRVHLILKIGKCKLQSLIHYVQMSACARLLIDENLS